MSDLFNGLLKSTRELPVTVMVRMSFRQLIEQFVGRSHGASVLVKRGIQYIPNLMKLFEKYRKRASWHTYVEYYNNRYI